MEGPGNLVLCFSWWCRWIPLRYRDELCHILCMTGPLLLSRILNYLLPFVVTMFCGRLGNKVMAGYGLATATINVTTAATGYGLGLACDTLVSQTFGGKNLKRVGVILQRSIIILLLFCLPCWGLLLNAQNILVFLGQDVEVAGIAQLYITAYLPAVPATFLHHLQMSYLQNQGIILPQLYAAAGANIANVLINYALLHWLELGVSGSAAANTLAQICVCVFLFAYIWWKQLHVKTWGGWSMESLQEWGSFMKLALPSSLMKCFEWWVYEFGGFFAGMLSEDELAAQHAVMMVSFITYMFPVGVQAAACARVGNALGAGDTARAILTCKVSFAVAGGFALIEGVVLGSTKSVIGFIFTSDKTVIGLVSNLMNVYCFLQFFDGLVVRDAFTETTTFSQHDPTLFPQCVCTGIFLGTGRQRIPAVANFIGYYCIGLTLCVTFVFVAKLRILGFWLGLLICVILQSTFYITVIFNLNWRKMTEEAVERALKNAELTLFQTSIKSSENLELTGSCDNAGDDYISVPPAACDTRLIQKKTLSSAQLFLRRGLTMFVAVSLLLIGASVHILVPVPSVTNGTTDWSVTVNTSLQGTALPDGRLNSF
ncbi:multidrug and toxin extrusion protein 1-like isoform X1 [Synchiropus splendidus]|uniref:multidrug and toxin extrusion protein 1-like isoform X1 n=1 Tax=Synchiropus splendidus TaxID=270530 RepID=UPI00237E3FC7|nr:multidrug and toxin extrusion protein 1-like isoform X1 [Synchiropus splendidus]